MQEYLNKGIKDLLTQFPELGNILMEYNIGCVSCNVGTCLLKDIMEIHNLPETESQELLSRMAAVILPGQAVQFPRLARKSGPKGEIKYSPPIKKLVDEHRLIKRWLALIPEVIKNLDIKSEKDRRLVLDGVDFIRSYADKYHHAKEEDILFKYFDPSLDVLKVMAEDHQKGRGYARNTLAALDNNDRETIVKNLTAYCELLTEHIKKEDEILYPWMDRNLTTGQVDEMFAKFNKIDTDFGDTQRKYEQMIQEVTNNLNMVPT